MRSHTVPRKLLDQFAYDDALTRSRRMWRYEKGKAPRWDASPRTAMRIDKHFADPENAAKEEALEVRLNRDFEEPVNQFLFRIGEPSFHLTDDQRRQLAFYVTLLFLRSEARKRGSAHTQQVMRFAMNKFLANDYQIFNVAAKWSIDAVLGDRRMHRLFTRSDVIEAAHKYVLDTEPTLQAKRSYIRMLEAAMENVDDVLLNGQWNYIRTTVDKPFLISDAPVVTWQRNRDGHISYGTGFHRTDVEVFLPISPNLCLHILPDVQRTQLVLNPSIDDINAAEAAMATRYCYTNVHCPTADRMVQEFAGSAELGVKSFTVWHRNYDNSFYDLFMKGGRWSDPQRL